MAPSFAAGSRAIFSAVSDFSRSSESSEAQLSR